MKKILKDIEKDLDKGQHFLIDHEVLKKEVSVAQLSKKDFILEIGAGDGNLTRELVRKAGRVNAFETDRRYQKKLASLKKSSKNIDLFYVNALDSSWKKYTKIVSNIPYFLSELVINKSIKDEVPELVLIVGEKFKEKLKNNESKIGMISNLFYYINYICKVNKTSFSPPPRIDSWLIKLVRKTKFSEKESLLLSILMRKGKLKNALLYSFIKHGKTKRESKELIKKMSLNEFALEKPTSEITKRVLLRLISELEIIRKEL